MRTLGRQPPSTVATAMASGSLGSAALASSNQAANSRSGSSASVKSPLLNQVWCSIGTVSDIFLSDSWGFLVTGRVPGPAYRAAYHGFGYNACVGSRLWQAIRPALRQRLAVGQSPSAGISVLRRPTAVAVMLLWVG